MRAPQLQGLMKICASCWPYHSEPMFLEHLGFLGLEWTKTAENTFCVSRHWTDYCKNCNLVILLAGERSTRLYTMVSACVKINFWSKRETVHWLAQPEVNTNTLTHSRRSDITKCRGPDVIGVAKSKVSESEVNYIVKIAAGKSEHFKLYPEPNFGYIQPCNTQSLFSLIMIS